MNESKITRFGRSKHERNIRLLSMRRCQFYHIHTGYPTRIGFECKCQWPVRFYQSSADIWRRKWKRVSLNGGYGLHQSAAFPLIPPHTIDISRKRWRGCTDRKLHLITSLDACCPGVSFECWIIKRFSIVRSRVRKLPFRCSRQLVFSLNGVHIIDGLLHEWN